MPKLSPTGVSLGVSAKAGLGGLVLLGCLISTGVIINQHGPKYGKWRTIFLSVAFDFMEVGSLIKYVKVQIWVPLRRISWNHIWSKDQRLRYVLTIIRESYINYMIRFYKGRMSLFVLNLRDIIIIKMNHCTKSFIWDHSV